MNKHTGVGKAIISGYLYLYNPNKFPLINGASISGIEAFIGKQNLSSLKKYAEVERTRLDIAQEIKNSDFRTYLAFMRLLKEICSLDEFKNYHYVDLLLWKKSREHKGEIVPDNGNDKKETLYKVDDLAKEIYFEKNDLEEMLHLLKTKYNIVFYGPPGTGKTYVAKKVANYLAKGKKDNVKLIQFHQNYSYEDFIEGIRPVSKEHKGNHIIDYPIMAGTFKKLCEKATNNSKENFVLIIDEFNRGNISKIFGELLYSLEYRTEINTVELPYSKEAFYIPKNLYLIATMNTADRSLTHIDFAMRRRFAFYRFNVDTNILVKWGEEREFVMDSLITLVNDINEKIGDENFFIGISFFMRDDLPQVIRHVWKYEIYPYLEEYFIDDDYSDIDNYKWEKVRYQLKDLIE